MTEEGNHLHLQVAREVYDKVTKLRKSQVKSLKQISNDMASLWVDVQVLKQRPPIPELTTKIKNALMDKGLITYEPGSEVAAERVISESIEVYFQEFIFKNVK